MIPVPPERLLTYQESLAALPKALADPKGWTSPTPESDYPLEIFFIHPSGIQLLVRSYNKGPNRYNNDEYETRIFICCRMERLVLDNQVPMVVQDCLLTIPFLDFGDDETRVGLRLTSWQTLLHLHFTQAGRAQWDEIQTTAALYVLEHWPHATGVAYASPNGTLWQWSNKRKIVVSDARIAALLASVPIVEVASTPLNIFWSQRLEIKLPNTAHQAMQVQRARTYSYYQAPIAPAK